MIQAHDLRSPRCADAPPDLLRLGVLPGLLSLAGRFLPRMRAMPHAHHIAECGTYTTYCCTVAELPTLCMSKQDPPL